MTSRNGELVESRATEFLPVLDDTGSSILPYRRFILPPNDDLFVEENPYAEIEPVPQELTGNR